MVSASGFYTRFRLSADQINFGGSNFLFWSVGQCWLQEADDKMAGRHALAPPPISTITFFRGPTASSEKYFSRHVGYIVHANLWLASVLDRAGGSGEMAAFYGPGSESAGGRLFRGPAVHIPGTREPVLPRNGEER